MRFTNWQNVKTLFVAILAITVIASFAIPVNAATLTVANDGSGQYNSIQAAHDAAVDGDTLNVTPGVYYETVDVSTANLTIQNANPDDGTVYIVALKSNGPDGTLAVNSSDTPNNGNLTIGNNVTQINKSVATVGDSGSDFLTIQSAVNNSAKGTAIRIKNGTYNESVTVDTNFILFEAFNEDANDVTIDAENTSSGEAIIRSANEIDETGSEEIYVTEDINLLNAVLAGGGGAGSSIDSVTFFGSFMGIPYWVIGLVLVVLLYWYYVEREEK